MEEKLGSVVRILITIVIYRIFVDYLLSDFLIISDESGGYQQQKYWPTIIIHGIINMNK